MKLDDRFARHRLIEGFSQELVSGLKLAVIGAGAIGNEFIKNLLLMGVAAIDVFDFDTVELSNLTRSVFLRERDLGTNKAEALVARAQELHPDTVLRAIPGDIARTLSLRQFASYDMVIAAVDNLEARLRINDMALLMKADWLNLAIDSRSVVVEVFPFQEGAGACYACSLSTGVFERMAARYSCGGLQRAAWLERKIPTTTITASAVAALACSEMLRFMHQKRQPDATPQASLFGGYRIDTSQRVYLDTVTPSVSRSFIRKAGAERGCPGCALHGSARSLTNIPDKRTIATGFLRSDEPTIQSLDRSPQIALNSAFATIAQIENCPVEMLQIRMSDPLILSCACALCPTEHGHSSTLKALKGTRAREQKDTLASCPRCQQLSVVFEICESLSLAEFQSYFANALPDCAWLTVNDHCIDLLGDLPQHSTARPNSIEH